MKKFASTLLATFALLAMLLSPLAASTAFAQAKNNPNSGGASSSAKDAACQGVALTGGDCNSTNPDKTVNSVIANVINIFSLIVGVTAVIMIMVGGLKYVTSSGDSASVNGAKNTILYAVIGLIVVALAQVIVRFVIRKV